MAKVNVKKITISDKIYIEKQDIEDLNELQSAYTYYNGEEFITTLEENDTHYAVPSNSYHKLNFEEVVDNRIFKYLDYQLDFTGTLRPEQQAVVNQFMTRGRARSGIIQAPCGFGKTFTSCALIAGNNTKTLILVHTKLLFRQWIEELSNLLPDSKIGRIGDGLFDIQDITVAIYKTVYNNISRVNDEFSTVIVDEAHLCPAETFSFVLNNMQAKIKIGVTATPRRKDGKHIFFQDYFTPYLIAAEDSRKLADVSVRVVETDIQFRVADPKRDWSRQVNKLASNENYLDFIAAKAIEYIKQGRCPLILADRVQMLKDLQEKIPNSICLLGETKEEARKDVLQNVGGKYKAVLSTKLFDEGISCHRLDTLFLTCPNNNTIKLEQRVGRIIREHPEKQKPLVVDFWLKGHIAVRQQNNRLDWYKQNGYHIL